MAPALLELWAWLCPRDWVRSWLSRSFLTHNPATQPKAASRRPWYGRSSKVWWWCLNSRSYLNARNYLSWKTPRNEISPLFIFLLAQPEHLVKVRLWVFLSLNFLACNPGWWPVRVHNLLQLLIRSFLPGRVPTGNIRNIQEQSKRASLLRDSLQTSRDNAGTSSNSEATQIPRDHGAVGPKTQKETQSHGTRHPGHMGDRICVIADRVRSEDLSLLPDPPHLLSGLPSDQSNRRDRLASLLVNFQRSPSRGGEEREDSRVDPWWQRHAVMRGMPWSQKTGKLCNCT